MVNHWSCINKIISEKESHHILILPSQDAYDRVACVSVVFLIRLCYFSFTYCTTVLPKKYNYFQNEKEKMKRCYYKFCQYQWLNWIMNQLYIQNQKRRKITEQRTKEEHFKESSKNRYIWSHQFNINRFSCEMSSLDMLLVTNQVIPTYSLRGGWTQDNAKNITD